MRVRFDQIFHSATNQIIARIPVRVSGIMATRGAPVTVIPSLSGIRLSQFVGNDLEIAKGKDGVMVVKGVYE